MNMSTTSLVWLVIVVVLVVLGGWYFLSVAPAPAPAPTNPTNTPPTTSGDTNVNIDVTTAPTPTSVTVTYSSSGFSPSPVTIKKGGAVTFVDSNPSVDMWVASAMHPTHSVYSGTSLSAHCDDTTDNSFDQCKVGSSYSFTFTKVGTWGYHNHSQSSDFGQVIVVE
ncbi:hypothetical protein A2943_02355 [Candidatus Adlerbacteria bacterium RIFCSPLOWO2_01_FULL_51_16]|uniref:EfeO-type cupredoxin-like domain-containing protein n=1 Tax=Candidatus Adlerbacteria bacterium RIFCSPLOWO2_01_FULL_51_16 TaxID=1797243 RepID=A0A1F4XGG1_9BACT|nr:MAG: hypothetical protein A2943_02355 [Candidatus Adlerbacteria bacterium RIFCSPLOWO2_01_FULL_51_16]